MNTQLRDKIVSLLGEMQFSFSGAKSLIVQHSLLNTRGRKNQLGHSTNYTNIVLWLLKEYLLHLLWPSDYLHTSETANTKCVCNLHIIETRSTCIIHLISIFFIENFVLPSGYQVWLIFIGKSMLSYIINYKSFIKHFKSEILNWVSHECY